MIEFIRFLQNLRRKKKNTYSLCPKCGDPRIQPSTSLSGWLTPELYLCKKCGYTGPIFLEVEKPPKEDK